MSDIPTLDELVERAIPDRWFDHATDGHVRNLLDRRHWFKVHMTDAGILKLLDRLTEAESDLAEAVMLLAHMHHTHHVLPDRGCEVQAFLMRVEKAKQEDADG